MATFGGVDGLAGEHAPVVRTVRGDLPAGALGTVDSHDHLFLATPALPRDQLAAAHEAEEDLRAFVDAGGRTLVQWTPRGLGRRTELLPELARAAGAIVVAATGRHRRAHYRPDHPLATGADELAQTFVDDVENGRCGLVKVGVGAGVLDEWERTSLAAAAAAHVLTGAPVAIHLEDGTAGLTVLAELALGGVAPESVVLGHVGRHPDISRAADLATTGAFLCVDGPRPGAPWSSLGLLERIAASGHLDRVLLGGDTTTRAGRGLAADLLRHTVPEVRAAIGESAVHALLVENPARAWRLRTAGVVDQAGSVAAMALTSISAPGTPSAATTAAVTSGGFPDPARRGATAP